MNIKIIVLGKFKETHWKEAEAEYLKRLKPYAKIEIIELKEESFRDGDDHMSIKHKEAERVLKQLDKGTTVIALSEDGATYDSPAFAAFLEKQTVHGEHLTFVIGGPLGLHDSIKKAAHHTLSLSSLTFPHQMVRVILAEQLYRAVTIQKGKQYHY